MTKDQLILEAIKAGNLDYVRKSYDDKNTFLTGPLFNVKHNHQKCNNTIGIHYACEHGQFAIVQFLVNKNPGLLNIPDSLDQTPVLWAAANNHSSLVEYLASKGANLNKATRDPGGDYHGYCAIHWAVERGHHHVLACLLKYGADFNIRIIYNERHHLIHIAAVNGHIESLKILLEKAPELLDLKDALDQTPVLWAASRNHVSLVEYLINQGANLTIATNLPNTKFHGCYPIHWAAGRGYHEVVKILLNKSPELLNLKDAYDQTPVCWAAGHGHHELVLWLINQGADLYMRHGKAQCHLIHIAAETGQVEVVKVLLAYEPELLNLVDTNGQTPMFWAAAHGHSGVVDCLIAQQADINIAINQPDHPDHGKTPLVKALEGKHFEAANLLILKIIGHQSKETILPLIESGLQAIEFMVQDPSLIKLILQDDRLINLISSTSCKITKDSILWYKPSGRRKSMIASIDKESETVSLFKPVVELGRGVYGAVRLFQSNDGQDIAVKSLTKIANSKHGNILDKLVREANFNKLAYPDDDLPVVFTFETKINNQKTYLYRMIMPYVKGERLSILIQKIICPRQLAKITLKIAEEVQRIHELGIMHGDLHDGNILIHEDVNHNFHVRLIDFGLSSHMTELSALFFSSSAKADYLPPELFVGKKYSVTPHPSLDIYRLGYFLNFYFAKHPLYQEIMRLFPVIEAFVVSAKNVNPTKRPCLKSFCNELTIKLKDKIDVKTVTQSVLIKNSLWFKPGLDSTFIREVKRPESRQKELCVML